MKRIQHPAFAGIAIITCSILSACGAETPDVDTSSAPETRQIGMSDLLNAGANTSEWLSYGRTWSEQRYSQLDQINRETVADLSLVWSADLDTARGQEATPLVIDGKMYITTAWSMVKAYDAVTGDLLWEYDPDVPGATGVRPCCDVVNRGLAAWGDRLYFGSLDGRLIALDRETGEPVWETMTVDQSLPYTITGAPRAIDGMILIGNGGADMGRIRGYVSAYDADSGEMLWRFYTVPDNPEAGPQPAYLDAAAETWTGDWWELGGGGTVWDSMAYDPDLGLLYIGVGNGAPWNQQYRSPGGGDNLYLSSIVAIHASTGEYAWHFQTTPGETWDYTATQHIILADMEIEGETRQVLMQAPKNGFFYVLDRETGEFLSANNYTNVSWALGIDTETGRPVENPSARYLNGPALVAPSAFGGHNWHPMAFNPNDGLVYIPVHNLPMPYDSPDAWDFAPFGFNIAIGDREHGPIVGSGDAPITRPDPSERTLLTSSEAEDYQRVEPRSQALGSLLAWDPVTQTEAWRVEYPAPWNGGLLTTGGGLVFQGTSMGQFSAYNSSDGERLWSLPIQTGAIAAPMTFEQDGTQYIALVAGWGGVFGLNVGLVENRSRIFVFALNGEGEMPEAYPVAEGVLDPPTQTGDAASIQRGSEFYLRFCSTCHGGGVIPDLRYSAALEREDTFMAIVRDGALEANGMVSFSEAIPDEDISAIRDYIISLAHAERERLQASSDD
ncbi:PQQ-dependent dehydrogenase, methanol/ethanol family [Ponticaulis sp.]|uniref:PQQ-dependent dehydrogenase, methanol/ethanol family n=1 Tax=Ponticaulis sp. TaxID=2020902 RepID=UPI000B6A6100|nr:PQQ-dependent dehydrogenase, methanol/ethanol family [Ponticaulis sp.]MAI91510.1 PQQ-dependent dehydrogenase, methanol/ethanol family [Ponticaulis sp.]OUX97473.1 MAG: PQQ-dependent dehydrogenase, methanol/ethanol family [Hyphomonadaceae bacterium TMED5]|tara:strand:+ start:20189 stop:22372 length:2184 start_codon:yes stop_codon:yes gene_type:complete